MVFASGEQTSQVEMSRSDLTDLGGAGQSEGVEPSLHSGGNALTSTRTMGPPKSRRNSDKKIVEINVDQARQLIANISPLSQKTLMLFVYGDQIAVASLVGPGSDYPDLTALKKSLIGGVVRRLRTVTGNRDAVLFASDPDRSVLFIKPGSASALRQAFNLPEREQLYDHPNEHHDDEMSLDPSAPL